MPQIVWILYLTSEEGTFINNLFLNGTGGASGWSRRRSSGMHNSHDNGMYASESSGLRGAAAERGMSSHDIPTTTKSNGTYGGMASYGSGGMGGGMDMAPHSTGGVPVSTSRDDFSAAGQSVDNVVKQKAKANYAYSASPDDPNEVSFAKGEILVVLDNTGKWYQVRTASGQQGVSLARLHSFSRARVAGQTRGMGDASHFRTARLAHPALTGCAWMRHDGDDGPADSAQIAPSNYLALL